MSEEDSLPFHHWLIADTCRTGTYQKAISQVVRKNDVVLDIGAGSGILSFFACLAGARKVYAVEKSAALPLARELCASNGLNDIVEFRQGRSQEIQLPEPVDVIISDTGCSFGLQGGLLGILLDAKKRFLKPGGRIIPHSLQLLVAPVELNDRRNLDIWEKDRYGLDLSSIRRFAANTDYHFKVEPERRVGASRFTDQNSLRRGQQSLRGGGDTLGGCARRRDARVGSLDRSGVGPRHFLHQFPAGADGGLDAQLFPHRETGCIAERRSRPS